MSGHWKAEENWETYSLGSFPGQGGVFNMADSSVPQPVPSLSETTEKEQTVHCLPANEATILSSCDSGVVISKANDTSRQNPFDCFSDTSETPSTSSVSRSPQTSQNNQNVQFDCQSDNSPEVQTVDPEKMSGANRRYMYREHSPSTQTGQFLDGFIANTDDRLPFVAYENDIAEEPVRMRPHGRYREFGTHLRTGMSQGCPVVRRDQDGPRNLRDFNSIFGSKSRTKKRYVPPKTSPQRVQSISERFYDESSDQQTLPQSEDIYVSGDDDPTRRAQIKQSKKLPGWVWYILSKSLGIRTFPGEKRIIATILHVMTLVFGFSFFIAYTWQRIYDIVSVYTKSTVLTGTVEIIICLCWVALTIYANTCAARLFSSRKFMLSVRLHSKTIFKVSAVGLIGFLAVVFMVLNSYHSFSTISDDHCLNVNLTIVVCKVLYPARVSFNVFGIIWNLLVAFVLMSVCRTHTVGVRRFIKELELDGKRYEKYFKDKMSGTSDKLLLDHFHEATDADLGSDWFIWDDRPSPTPEQMVTHAALRRRSRNSLSGRQSLQGTSIDEEQEDGGEGSTATTTVNGEKGGTLPAHLACPVLEDYSDLDTPPIMTNEDILICYWKISCRMRVTSICLQRWLSSWILFVVLWCSNYVIYWTSHDASIMGIAEFIIPLIMIPLVASAYAEVNTEGQRMIRSICPVEERMALLFYLGQQPLQMTVFNFPVTYQGIVGVIAAFSVAFASRIILDEVLG